MSNKLIKTTKIKITIEETISQEFEVEVKDVNNPYEEIRQMYIDEKLVLDNATLTSANIGLPDKDGNTNWVSIYD